MSRSDKIGLGVLVGLFVLFGLLLALTVRPMSDKTYSPEDSFFVQQRIQNLQQSR